MNEDRMRELFREMREEPAPADSLARVRMAVAGRTAKAAPRPFWLRWPVFAAAAAAFVLAVLLRWEPAPPPAPVVAKREQPAAPPAVQPPVRQPVASPPMAKKRPQVQAVKRDTKQDLLIRMETPDPNVVIFLIADGAGE